MELSAQEAVAVVAGGAAVLCRSRSRPRAITMHGVRRVVRLSPSSERETQLPPPPLIWIRKITVPHLQHEMKRELERRLHLGSFDRGCVDLSSRHIRKPRLG